MRRIVLILIIIILTATSTAAGITKNEEMTDLAAMVTEHNLAIDGWQVTIKEQMTAEKVKQLMDILREKNSHLVSSTEDENTIKYSFSYAHKTNDMSENYNVVIPKNKAYDAQFIAVMKGNSWNDSIEKTYFTRLNSIKSAFFGENSTKFACLTTTLSDKIKSVYFFNRVKELLNLKNIRSQNDTLKQSMIKEIKYGYTPMWNQKLKIGDKPMNFQMAIKKSQSGNTKLTIGTPILITEY
ncbi:YwmB family TATA-box binding protein [Virgibacillus doumboii]|uniref:YwmB family TATA-box binding protein n=1 Tax=Virgibacillus doumboii TaxID=2697503 RepID=UPI0013DEC025|nr:YwmB family TATA-box binding protein [Virgibacillus doumboii]